MTTEKRPPPATANPAEIWDQQVASALAQSIGKVILPRRKNLVKLRLSKDKVQQDPGSEAIFPWPRAERSIAGIDETLRGIIRKLVGGEAPWPLFLTGGVGVGKTCAAACLLDLSGGLYFTVPHLCFRMIQAQQGGLDWSQPGGGHRLSEAALWDWIKKVPLVVMDELGCRDRVSDHHYDTVKRVIDARECSPLIAVSNWDQDELARFYDDRVASRLAAGTSIELLGKDLRMEAG
jgi:hypothetical protein